MNKIRKFLRQEKGGYQMIEASIMYPITFLMIMLLIYIGLYLLQLSTLSSYAQKIALLASREVSCPGYRTMVNAARFSTTAAELDFSLKDKTGKMEDGTYANKLTISNKVEDIKLRAYRYWSSDPLNSDEKAYYTGILYNLAKQNSILRGSDDSDMQVTIKCSNYVISQFVEVEISQELAHFGVLDFFGIEQPGVKISATAAVSDTDELVRNTDFAADAIEALARRFGIDTTSIKKTVKDCLTKLGLVYGDGEGN